MRRVIAVVAAAVLVLLALGTTGVILAQSDDGQGWGRHPMATSRDWSDDGRGGGRHPMATSRDWSDDGRGGGRHPMATSRDWSDDGRGGGRHPMMMFGGFFDDEAGWLREMVAHHREAVAAAGELSRSDEPAMRAFGRTIVADQSAQIRLMEEWLAQWHPDEPTEVPYEPMMRDLSDLTGAVLDRAFLEDMIGHHMAAVMMSQQLLAHGVDEHDEVADLARTIRTDQMSEIRWMQARLGDFSPGWRRAMCGWSTMTP